MATQAAIFPPASEHCVEIAGLTTSSSSSSQLCAPDMIFVITADQNVNIAFGNAANVANPTAADFPIWKNSYVQLQVPNGDDRFRIFNGSGSTGNIWWWQLSRG